MKRKEKSVFVFVEFPVVLIFTYFVLTNHLMKSYGSSIMDIYLKKGIIYNQFPEL